MSTTNLTVESSKPISQMTDEERKKRYTELRAIMGHSRIQVEGQKGKHYLWASKDDSYEMIRLEHLGYSVVHESDSKIPKIKAAGLKSDGTYQVGDVILMECPQEVYEFLLLDNEEKANALIYNAADNFKNEAAEKGIPTFDVKKPIRGGK